MDHAVATDLLAFAEAAAERMRRSDDGGTRDEVEARNAELRAAMDWFLAAEQRDEALRIASVLVPFWIASGRIDDGDQWFAAALEHTTGSDATLARGLYDHGYLVFWAGRYDLAAERFARARQMAEELRDGDLEALALAGSARVALNDDVGKAIRLLRRALDVTEEELDSPGRSSALHVLGVAHQMSGDLAAARDVMRQRLEWGRARNRSSVVFVESANLSMVERQLGNLDEAQRLSLDALRIVVTRRDDMAIPWVINGLAAVTAARGDLERAAVLIGIAEGLLERAGGEWPPDERAQYEKTLEMLAQAPSAGIAAGRATGRGMPTDEAIAYAVGPDQA